MRGCVLVLPGGQVYSEQPNHRRQLANVRMDLVTGALRARLGPEVEVRQVQYRLRGWNGARADPVRDARAVLDRAGNRFEPKQIVVVGHSMGGRVAAHLAAGGRVGAVVALAPWWANGDGALIPADTKLLVVHGTADLTTDPIESRIQTAQARERGVDAHWVGIDGVGHHMVRRWRRWHRLTTDFVADYLGC